MNAAAFWTGMEGLGLAVLGWHLLAFILCGLGLLLARILWKQSPYLRSCILRASLLGILFLPVFAVLKFSVKPAALESAGIVDSAAGASSFPKLDREKAMVWRPVLQEMAVWELNLNESRSFRFAGLSFLSVVPIFCLFFLGVGLVRLGMGMSRTAAWITSARIAGTKELDACKEMSKSMGIRAPRVLICSSIRSPMVAGVFRPVLLLPENLKIRDEVWRHELSHLRHGDILWNLLVSGFASCFPLQPLFSLLKKAMTEAAEERCDDAVLMRGGDPQTYAGLLVDLAEKNERAEVCSLTMARSSMLERRLRRFLDASWARQSGPLRRTWVGALGLLLLGIGGTGWAFADMRESMAQGAIAQSSADKTETKEYGFSVHPITEFWKNEGFRQRLVVLDDPSDITAWGFRILSDKIADYLESLAEKKVKVMIRWGNEKSPKIVRIGDLDLSHLAAGEVENQAAVKATGRIDPAYSETTGKLDSPAASYDGRFKLESDPPRAPSDSFSYHLGDVKLQVNSPPLSITDGRPLSVAQVNQGKEGKTETSVYGFQVLQPNEEWKQRGLKQRAVNLVNQTEEGAWGFLILSDKIAEYLESQPGKTVKASVYWDREKGPRLVQIGKIELANLAAGEVEKQMLLNPKREDQPYSGQMGFQSMNSNQ